LKPESQENIPDDVLSELNKQIEELKLKQQTEMDTMLSKLVTKTVHKTKDMQINWKALKKQNFLPVSHFCIANLRCQDKLVSQVKWTN
jgi:hypothetical protein